MLILTTHLLQYGQQLYAHLKYTMKKSWITTAIRKTGKLPAELRNKQVEIFTKREQVSTVLTLTCVTLMCHTNLDMYRLALQDPVQSGGPVFNTPTIDILHTCYTQWGWCSLHITSRNSKSLCCNTYYCSVMHSNALQYI